MPRPLRIDIGDYAYHVINRANGRARIFHTEVDYKDFELLLFEMNEFFNMRILAYTIMPNHWHLLLYPKEDGDIQRAIHWLSTSHAVRHHTRNGTIGGGHLYQGRYKSFLIQKDKHLLTVLKYIERNPVRAKLCKVVEGWKWGSAYRRKFGESDGQRILSEPPVPLPVGYEKWINYAEPAEDLEKVRHCIRMGESYGSVVLRKNITP